MNLNDLTIRHQLIIAWTAMGLSRKQISGLLKLHSTRVDSLFLEIKQRIGFCDIASLTHYALLAGLAELMEFGQSK